MSYLITATIIDEPSNGIVDAMICIDGTDVGQIRLDLTTDEHQDDGNVLGPVLRRARYPEAVLAKVKSAVHLAEADDWAEADAWQLERLRAKRRRQRSFTSRLCGSDLFLTGLAVCLWTIFFALFTFAVWTLIQWRIQSHSATTLQPEECERRAE